MPYNCKLESLIGFSYKVPNSLIFTLNFKNPGILMPLSNSVRLYDGEKNVQVHKIKREVSALDLRGHYLVIGEKASKGQLISATFLDVRSPEKVKVFNYQKTQIDHIAVSANGEYLCTSGSSDEFKQELAIIEINNQSEVGTKVLFHKIFKKSDGKIINIVFSNNDSRLFLVLFQFKLIFFRITEEMIEEIVAKTSKVRQFNNIIFDPNDQFCYGCSKNGDIAQISIEEAKEVRVGPRKRVIIKGITNIRYAEGGYLVISGKQGFIGLVELKQMRLLKQIAIQGNVLNMTEFYQGEAFLSTDTACIYKLNLKEFDVKMHYTCHTARVNAVSFLEDFSDIFGTCSGGQIILWKTQSLKPIIKILYGKIICFCLHFPRNGKYLLSGWSDDSIKIFSPCNGKLIRKIEECNLGKVTALLTNEDCTMLMAGGDNGMIRVWSLEGKNFCMIRGSLAYHTKTIHTIKINPYNTNQLIACCEDGNYSVWSISDFQLKAAFYVDSFLNNFLFENQFKIMLVGSGSAISQCMISNGVTHDKIQLSGSCINILARCTLEKTKENIIFYGGDEPFLSYFDESKYKKEVNKIDSYGEIVNLAVSPDGSWVICGTANGYILAYSLFSAKKDYFDK